VRSIAGRYVVTSSIEMATVASPNGFLGVLGMFLVGVAPPFGDPPPGLTVVFSTPSALVSKNIKFFNPLIFNETNVGPRNIIAQCPEPIGNKITGRNQI